MEENDREKRKRSRVHMAHVLIAVLLVIVLAIGLGMSSGALSALADMSGGIRAVGKEESEESTGASAVTAAAAMDSSALTQGIAWQQEPALSVSGEGISEEESLLNIGSASESESLPEADESAQQERSQGSGDGLDEASVLAEEEALSSDVSEQQVTAQNAAQGEGTAQEDAADGAALTAEEPADGTAAEEAAALQQEEQQSGTMDSSSEASSSAAAVAAAHAPRRAARAPAAEGSGSVNLAEAGWVSSVVVEKKVAGTEDDYEKPKDGVFTSGDSVRATINFKVPGGELSAPWPVLTYQFPSQFVIPETESGSLTDPNRKDEQGNPLVLGTYTIGTDGKMTITLSDNYVPSNDLYAEIKVSGTMVSGSTSGSETITFPGMGDNESITIKKEESSQTTTTEKSHDLSVDKKAELSADKKSVTYTVTVSTERGTKKAVSIQDFFWKSDNADPAYRDAGFSLVKVGADGQEIPVSLTDYPVKVNGLDWANKDGEANFVLENLPALAAGETYRLTYVVDVNEKAGTDGHIDLGNTAAGTSGSDSDSSSTQTTTTRMVNKEFLQASGKKLFWRVTVNEAHRDLTGFTFTDVLPEGVTLDEQSVVVRRDSRYGEIQDKPWAKLAADGKSFSMDFSTAADPTATYVIEYATTAPELAEGETAQVQNTGTLGGNGESWSSTGGGTVVGSKLGVQKSAEKTTLGADGNDLTTWWWSTLTLPGEKLSSFTFTDTIDPSVTAISDLDQSEQILAGRHYAIASELYADLYTAYEEGNRYYQNYRLKDADGAAYECGNGTACDGSGVSSDKAQSYYFTLKCYDAQGREVPVTDLKTHVQSFVIEVHAIDGRSIDPTLFEVHYRTHVDAQVDPASARLGQTWSWNNIGAITSYNGRTEDVRASAESHYTFERGILKGASARWTGATDSPQSYTPGDLTAGMSETDGVICYRVLVTLREGDSGPITVTDTLPEGMSYIEGSLEAAFYQDDYYHPTVAPNNSAYDLAGGQKPQVKADGQTLTFTILAGYEAQIGTPVDQIELLYRVSVKGDSAWQDLNRTKKPYVNTVTRGDETFKQETTVTRQIKSVEKKGEQVRKEDGSYTNVFRYRIEINPKAEDLNPDGDKVLLTDTLSLPDGVSAALDLNAVKLYAYDVTTEDHLGQEIALESFSYDEKTGKFEVQVQDGLACVLVYQYEIQGGSSQQKIDNTAQLGSEKTTSKELEFHTSSSGGSAWQPVVNLYKVDADNNSRFLQGAGFTLERYAGDEENTALWTEVTGEKKTDENGRLILQTGTGGSLSTDTLYRITEVTAPAGYEKAGPAYVVLLTNYSEAGKSAFYSGLGAAVRAEVHQDDILFLPKYGGTVMVRDQAKELTARKKWQNSDGTAADPGAESVSVKLYAAPKVKKQVTVSLEIYYVNDNNWRGQLWNQTYTQAMGKPVTVSWKKGDVNWGTIEQVTVNGKDVTTDAVRGTLNYTSDALSGDTSIVIRMSKWMSMGDNLVVETAAPQTVVDRSRAQEVTGQDAVLNADNGWSHTWDVSALPQKNAAGEELYYYVGENTSLVGYTTTYWNNDGARSGVITVVNRKLSTPPDEPGDTPSYSLPATGGEGTARFMAAGLLLLAVGLVLALRSRREEK